jgi:hypothetical protein
MVNGHARRAVVGAVAGSIDGPSPDRIEQENMLAILAALQAEHGPKIAEQDARYEVRIEAMGAMGVVKFTLLNKHITDLNPPAVYIPFANLLHLVGQYLVQTSGVGGHGG